MKNKHETQQVEMPSDNWRKYAAGVIDPRASMIQINEARAGFFGGAWAAWIAMSQISVLCEGNEELAKQLTEQLYNDIRAGCEIVFESLGGKGEL